MASIIEVKNIGKEYAIGERQRYLSLRDSLASFIKSPFGLIGGKKNRSAGSFWALKDVSFMVEPGEVLGIIGRNGAGKSTLLKILSRITPPTEGEIRLHGRVGSLLEVGTGFHPELTGRENIFLNGAILGMRKKEIEKKFAEIVEFSGIEKFLDTPVKRYSSGMYVRLAFSVAAHLEPEILIIDEVLAVGDAEFQKKCLGKMEEVTKGGRTVLFVSHNLGAVRNLCRRSILLDKGMVVDSGPSAEVIQRYLNSVGNAKIGIGDRPDRQGNGDVRAVDYHLKNSAGETVSFFASGADASIWLDCQTKSSEPQDVNIFISIDSSEDQQRLATAGNKFINKKLVLNGRTMVKLDISRLPLNIGRYQFTIFIESGGQILDWIRSAGYFDVGFGDFYGTGNLPVKDHGSILLDYKFNL